MRKRTYTRRELRIINAKMPMDISDEEFLVVLNKSIKSGDLDTTNILMDLYEDIFDRTQEDDYEKSHADPADKEDFWAFPILLSTSRNTERRIENIITYLTGKMDIDRRYITLLRKTVPYREVFNYVTEEYCKDYLADSLWTNYFLQVPEFKKIIMLRSIQNLSELISKAADYFEQYVVIREEKNNTFV